MPSNPNRPTCLIATRNAHKVMEIRSILGAKFEFLSLKDFPGAPDVVEDADTFAGNATKKAVELACWISNSPSPAGRHVPAFVLADDSGLEVDALNGAPGVHSARFAALDSKLPGNSPDADNNAKLLQLLRDVPLEKRAARFRCVVALVEVGRTASLLQPRLFDGVCEGRIQSAPSGEKGFGYDPLFVPQGCRQSFAELGEDAKNHLSHRAKALAKLRNDLQVRPRQGYSGLGSLL